jgi:hypothetical protein
MSVVPFKADFSRKLDQFFGDPDNCRYAEQVRHYLYISLQDAYPYPRALEIEKAIFFLKKREPLPLFVSQNSPNYKRFLTHHKIDGALRYLVALEEKPAGLETIIERMQQFKAELYNAFQRNASYGDTSR